jgi:hypothetical protein
MRKLSWIFALAFVAYACDTEDITPMDGADALGKNSSDAKRNNVAAATATPGPNSAMDVSAVIIAGANNGGNRTCEETSAVSGTTYAYGSGRINFEDGQFSADFPEGFTVSTDGTYVTWSYNNPGWCIESMAAIVKGSNDASVYFYGAGYSGDSGLAAPTNGGGGFAGLSNLTFCFNLVACETEEPELCTEDETATSAGPGISGTNNWFMYTAYEAGKTVDLIAGQHYAIGTVNFSAVVNGKVTITITMNETGYFQEVKDNIKIHGHAGVPTWGSPALGQYQYKSTVSAGATTATMVVDAANNYTVHVDGGRYYECNI